MARSLFITVLLASHAIQVVYSLNSSCAAGGNFDMSIWTLQLPTGSPGSPTTIPASQLVGCSGYQDPSQQFFFTEKGDGALVMKVPGSPASSGCVTTKKSLHCRTELRESNHIGWDPNGATNLLQVTVQVPQPDNSTTGTIIGQIHIHDSISVNPVCELHYNTSGDLNVGVKQTLAEGNKIMKCIANVPVGQQFTYEIAYQRNILSVSINGATPVTPSNSLGAPLSYFKVGNYNQGTVTSPSPPTRAGQAVATTSVSGAVPMASLPRKHLFSLFYQTLLFLQTGLSRLMQIVWLPLERYQFLA